MREVATSTLAGFHADPLFWSNLNLECWFSEEGCKVNSQDKNPWNKAKSNNKLDPHMALGRGRTRATLLGGERSLHCVIPATLRPKKTCDNRAVSNL